jgi:hypothetical protein
MIPRYLRGLLQALVGGDADVVLEDVEPPIPLTAMAANR